MARIAMRGLAGSRSSPAMHMLVASVTGGFPMQLWWGLVTMTTVGYGDIYPVMAEGRIAASVLLVLGIALFGVITATTTGLPVHGDNDSVPDPILQVERLHALSLSGAVTADEFKSKKAELLARL